MPPEPSGRGPPYEPRSGSQVLYKTYKKTAGRGKVTALVASADLLGSEPTVDSLTSDGQIYRLGYIGSKRYIRVAVTVSGATSGAVYGASIVRGAPRSAPVA